MARGRGSWRETYCAELSQVVKEHVLFQRRGGGWWGVGGSRRETHYAELNQVVKDHVLFQRRRRG